MGRVVIAGSINMDVVVTAVRHPRLGETVAGESVLYFPGGKGANQAVAAARLGARTALVGRVGIDAFGAELRAFLTDEEVDVSLVAGDNVVVLEVCDNGRGIAREQLSKPGSFGLRGIQERARSLHGDVEIESTPGAGTRVKVEIPLSTADGADATLSQKALF